MNLQNIWSGNDYAVLENRGRNDPFPFNARRVRAIRTFKRTEYGNDKATGYVECHFLDDEGNYREEPPRLRTVRARDFWSFWDEYENERSERIRHREELAAKERERLDQERKEKEQLLDLIESKGMPRTAIITVTDYSITLNKAAFEEWMQR